MSDDDVLHALQVLKRHGMLDDNFFFASASTLNRKYCFFLPNITTISPDLQNKSYRMYMTFTGNAAFDLFFPNEEKFKEFFLKWKQAKLAKLLY